VLIKREPQPQAHLDDVAGRKRVGLVCSSESAAQWHHNQRFRLIKDGRLRQEKGRKPEISNESARGWLLREANV